MLRLIVVALLLANGLFWLWSEGALRGFGYAPASQREPQRVAQQIQPEAVKILSPAEIQAIEAQVKADLVPKRCLQSSPLGESQVAVLRAGLEADWPTGSWQFDTVAVTARWMVYMGKFANEEALAKKRGELAAMNIKVHNVENPNLQLGLSLGSYDSEGAAAFELTRLGARGIRTARVMLERAPEQITVLRMPVVSDAMQPLVDKLSPALGAASLSPCP